MVADPPPLLRELDAPAHRPGDSPAPTVALLPRERGATEPAALAADEDGMIRDACPIAERMFDYRRNELIDRRLSDLLPTLDLANLVQDGRINPRLAFVSRCVSFDAHRRDGSRFACRIFLNKLDNPGRPPLLVLVRHVDDEATGLARTGSR